MLRIKLTVSNTSRIWQIWFTNLTCEGEPFIMDSSLCLLFNHLVLLWLHLCLFSAQLTSMIAPKNRSSSLDQRISGRGFCDLRTPLTDHILISIIFMVTFRGSNLEINERMKLMTEELILFFRASQVGHESRQVLQADITCQRTSSLPARHAYQDTVKQR